MTDEQIALDDLMTEDQEIELSEGELDALEAEELEEAEEEQAPKGYEDERETFGNRTFEIVEPNAGITLRIIKIVGALALRGEKNALRALTTVG